MRPCSRRAIHSPWWLVGCLLLAHNTRQKANELLPIRSCWWSIFVQILLLLFFSSLFPFPRCYFCLETGCWQCRCSGAALWCYGSGKNSATTATQEQASLHHRLVFLISFLAIASMNNEWLWQVEMCLENDKLVFVCYLLLLRLSPVQKIWAPAQQTLDPNHHHHQQVRWTIKAAWRSRLSTWDFIIVRWNLIRQLDNCGELSGDDKVSCFAVSVCVKSCVGI